MVAWVYTKSKVTFARSLHERNLRGASDPLQDWQCDLYPGEDEIWLELTPCQPAVETFALHHEVRHETQGAVMLLSPGAWWGCAAPGRL